MKTVCYPGGSVVIDDATADAVLEYSAALAERQRMDIVAVADGSSAGPSSRVVLMVGFGVPLSVRDPQAAAAITTSSDIRDRLRVLVQARLDPSDVDPRIGYDVDYDFLYTRPDPRDPDPLTVSSS